MKKWISSIVLVAMVVCGRLVADQDELLKFIPQQTRTMVYVNVEQFLNSEIVLEARATNLDVETAFSDAERVFAEAGFKPADFVQDMILCVDNSALIGALVTTRIPADKVPELFKKFAQSKNEPVPLIETAQLDGRSIIKTADSIFVYITKNVVLVLPVDSNVRTIVSGLGKILPRNRELVNFARKDLRGNFAWFVSKTPSAREMKEDATLANEVNRSIEFVYAKVVQTGEMKDTLELSGQAYCYEIRNAHKMVKDFTAVIGILSGSLFSDDSELAAKVMNAFSFTSKGKEFNFSLSLPRSLVDEIGAYIDYKKQAHAEGYDVNGGGLQMDLLTQSLSSAVKEIFGPEKPALTPMGTDMVPGQKFEIIEIENKSGGEMSMIKNVVITLGADNEPVSYQLNNKVFGRTGNVLDDSFQDLAADSPEAQKALSIYNEKKASSDAPSSSN